MRKIEVQEHLKAWNKIKRFPIFPYAIISLIIISAFPASAQMAKQLNLPKYDRASFQFGFMLGENSGNMVIEKVADFKYIDSAYSVESVSQSGLNLGIVVTKQFGSY